MFFGRWKTLPLVKLCNRHIPYTLFGTHGWMCAQLLIPAASTGGKKIKSGEGNLSGLVPGPATEFGVYASAMPG